MGGIDHRVGADGPWEPKRVLGTVPVEADGSALFRVPANTPISVQPLDAEGKALQLMRSWMTAMPGEIVSCVGCHETQNTAPPATATPSPPARTPVGDRAVARAGAGLQLPARGAAGARPATASAATTAARARRQSDRRPARRPGQAASSIKGGDPVAHDHRRRRHGGADRASTAASSSRRTSSCAGSSARRAGERPPPARRPWSSTPTRRELVQMLAQGPPRREARRRGLGPADHLDRPERARATAPGARPSARPRAPQRERRAELLQSSTRASDDDPEAIPETAASPPSSRSLPKPRSEAGRRASRRVAGWPFDAAEAQRRQAAAGPATRHASTWATA